MRVALKGFIGLTRKEVSNDKNALGFIGKTDVGSKRSHFLDEKRDGRKCWFWLAITESGEKNTSEITKTWKTLLMEDRLMHHMMEGREEGRKEGRQEGKEVRRDFLSIFYCCHMISLRESRIRE